MGIVIVYGMVFFFSLAMEMTGSLEVHPVVRVWVGVLDRIQAKGRQHWPEQGSCAEAGATRAVNSAWWVPRWMMSLLRDC
jgi:hypothetical protein